MMVQGWQGRAQQGGQSVNFVSECFSCIPIYPCSICFVIVLSLHPIFLPSIRFYHPSPSPRKERKGWAPGPYSIGHPRNQQGVKLFLFKKLLWFLFCLIAWLWKSQRLRIHFFELRLFLKVAVAFCLNLCSDVPSLTDMLNLFFYYGGSWSIQWVPEFPICSQSSKSPQTLDAVRVQQAVYVETR